MGIGFVLLFWAVIGGILAVVGAVVLGGATALLTRGAQRGRKGVILAMSLLPVGSLGWMGAVFFFQAIVNETVLHRDAGLGDSWRCPLPNGYALLMIDVPDHGWVYNPKTQPRDAVSERDDAISGVRNVQVAGRYILGARDSHWDRTEADKGQVDTYFLMDTQAGKYTEFSAYEELRESAQELGIGLNLEPIAAIYSRYRFTGFDIFAWLLCLLPPVVVAILLFLWLVQVRKSRETILHAAS